MRLYEYKSYSQSELFMKLESIYENKYYLFCMLKITQKI